MTTILVVDDSATDIAMTKALLEKHGYTVTAASNGADGIDKAKAEKPDLILMDIIMPNMNGFEATRKIKKDPATAAIPIVVISSKDKQADIEWARRQGAADYIIKPFTDDKLQASVNKALA